MTDLLLFFGGLALLLALDFVSLITRSAFLQTTHARLLALRDQMEPQVSRTSLLLSNLNRLRASLNFTLVLDRFLLAGLALYLVSRQSFSAGPPWASPLAASIIMLVVSALLLFWAEWVVERMALRSPEYWALRLTPFARVIMAVTSVFLALPLASTHDSQSSADSSSLVTEDELKTLVDAGQEEGVFEVGERRMIYSIFELGDTLAREIMVPRIDMLALDANTPFEQAVDALLQSGHSRAPVFDETVDNTLGLLYAKDLLRAWREGDQIHSLRPLLRPAYFIPEAKKVNELLEEMQSRRVHMAIVVDEYGGVAGLVTLEDIVEEILGEIRDEYDQAEESPYQALKDGEYLFQGRVDLDDFNEIMGSSLPKEEADTLGGFIYSQLGRVPSAGENVQKDGLLLTVEQVSARRIRKVRARWAPTGSDDGDKKDDTNG